MENKKFKAIVQYASYSKARKGFRFFVKNLYRLTYEPVKNFSTEDGPIALLADSSDGGNATLPENVNEKDYYEVLVEDSNSRDPLKYFNILSRDDFTPACLIYDNKWIRKNKNLFVSTADVFNISKEWKKYIPFDKEELLTYSEVSFEDGNFICEGGILKEYKLEDFDFLDYTFEVKRNKIYVLPYSCYERIQKKLVKEIDFIDKDQLKEWFIKAVQVDDEELADAIGKINDENLSKEAFAIRLERCKKLVEKFVFSAEDAFSFSRKKNIRRAIDEYSDKRKKQIDIEMAAEKQKSLEAIASYRDIEIEKKLADTKRELSDKEDILKIEEEKLTSVQTELASLEKDIEDKKNLLTTLENEVSSMKTTKSMIIEALKEEVRNQQPAVPEKDTSGDRNVNDMLSFGRSSDAEDIGPENYPLVFPNNKFGNQSGELACILIHKASVIPDISYAYAVAHLLTNTYVKVITVEHGWYHYEDFVKAGILDFYNEALSDENRNCLLVLENINVVPIECSLKPIIDLIDGRRLNLPGSGGKCFPKNLRILATVLPSAEEDDFGIKLNERVFRGFHFVETPTSRLSLPLGEVMKIEPRFYVDLKSLKIVDIVGDNGYSRYKDY